MSGYAIGRRITLITAAIIILIGSAACSGPKEDRDLRITALDGKDLTEEVVALWERANQAYNVDDTELFHVDTGNPALLFDNAPAYFALLNYDEVVNSIFTERGREQFEQTLIGGSRPLIVHRDGMAYRMGPWKTGMYFGDKLTDAHVVEQSDQEIVLGMQYAVRLEGRLLLDGEAPFTLLSKDGKWLVDYYEYPEAQDADTAPASDNQQAEAEGMPDALSDEDITAIAKGLLEEGHKVFWWYHSDFPSDLEIDQEEAGLVDDVYMPVGKFKTEAEMKAATESVFTNRFSEKILYPWGTGFGQDADGNAHYKEIGGALYYNSQMGGMGWNKKLTGEIAVKSREPGKVVVTAMVDELLLGADQSEIVPYDFILLKENGAWKLDNWYEYNCIYDRVKDYQNDLDPVLRAGILNTTWEKPSEIDPDLFVIFATYRNLDEPASWFDSDRYEITPEKDMLVPAEEVEAYVLPSFDIRPEQVRASRFYIPEKNAYIIGGVGGAGSAVAYNVDFGPDGYGIIFYNRYQDAMRVSEGSLRIVERDGGCSYLSNSCFLYPEAPREAVDDVVRSVTYDPDMAELRFAIPNQLPDGYELYLQITGSLKTEDGQMPFHAFEEEGKTFSWEPGKTYTYTAKADSVKEIWITAGLLAADDPTRVLNEIEMYLDGEGNPCFASDG